MEIRITRFVAQAAAKTVVVFAGKKKRLTPEAEAIDRRLDRAITQAARQGRFSGKADETLPIAGLAGGRLLVVLVGLGDLEGRTANDWRKTGLTVGKKLDTLGAGEAVIALGGSSGALSVPDAAEPLIEGLGIAAYRFDRFRTQRNGKRPGLARVTVAIDGAAVAPLKKRLTRIVGLLAGSELARDLVNLPPNLALPSLMVREANRLTELGIGVQVLGPERLKRLGMNLMLAVGRGAEPAQQPRLILLTYRGAGARAPLTAVVGKGVMFDSGGYGIKTAEGMKHMKTDMSGAAAVMGLMKALALRKSRANVLGVCGCVVNLISDRAYLPGSVFTAYNGKTVEIAHTDAEGRLVLADAMAYVADRHRPARMIDIATLTGACSSALGGQYAGLFTADEGLAGKLTASGQETGERLWRLPLDDAYATKASVADLSNGGAPHGGASAAAVFLKNFVGKTPWVHLDIAGVAHSEKVPNYLPVKGASGFGVRVLAHFIESAG